MASFLNYALCFSLGCIFALFVKNKFLSKNRPEPKIDQLQTDKNQLELDKTNLQNRNGDLREIISQTQREIVSNKREIKELKKVVGVLSSQVILCLDLVGGITKIQESGIDINAQIIITKSFQKKYEQFYTSD
jgi:hypothetical protein